MQAILIHGMGRTPLSMCLLAMRLRLAGMRPRLFGYSAMFEGWHRSTSRLARFIERHTGLDDYIVVGHSLGSVLARTAFALKRLLRLDGRSFPASVFETASSFSPRMSV